MYEQWALDPAQGIKPLDFGAYGLTGSVDASGGLIALNTYHERYGYITLTTAEPFPETERYNSSAVRAYRRSLVSLTGFGPHFEQPIIRREAFLLEQAVPFVRLTFADGTQADVTTFVDERGGVQIWRCPSDVRWHGRLSLQRCAYAQLTEGGPVEMPPIHTHAVFSAGVLTLENAALNRTVAVAGFPLDAPRWEQLSDGPVEIDLLGQPGVTVLRYAFGRTADDARARAADSGLEAETRLERVLSEWRQLNLPSDRVLARGVAYGRMLVVPVDESCCLLTDHMLLPLSWNRDAYYTAMALLDREPDTVRRHLLWLFEVAERLAGTWGRSYLANGRIKDSAFQLDQQMFPLLELADYVIATGDHTTWERLRVHIDPVFHSLMARRYQDDWLFPTDETPADDPLVLPYHLSSHILIWHALRRLQQIEARPEWSAAADAVRHAVLHHFTINDNGERLLAYAVDGSGHFYLYHDANDLPLVLAPHWGFVPANDPVWQATIRFAFSDRNTGGVYNRRLGSVHSPAPWALGDIQDLIAARLLNDRARQQRALDHVQQAAQWDGALPEAYDATTGEVFSRHWFAWPNAMLVLLLQPHV